LIAHVRTLAGPVNTEEQIKTRYTIGCDFFVLSPCLYCSNILFSLIVLLYWLYRFLAETMSYIELVRIVDDTSIKYYSN